MLEPAPPRAHTPLDDAQALVTGALFVAFGLVLFRAAGLLTGGTAGLALLAHYATGLPFGALFFAINLPFVLLALRWMGGRFVAKSFAAVALLSIAAEWLPRWIGFDPLATGFAAVMGGALCGAGLLMLFRHHASLGGINVLALGLQRARGWSAGLVQGVLDAAIVAAAFVWVDPARIAWSIVGALVLNLVIAINHRPGRYFGV